MKKCFGIKSSVQYALDKELLGPISRYKSENRQYGYGTKNNIYRQTCEVFVGRYVYDR